MFPEEKVDNMDRGTAAEAFAKMLLHVGVDETIASVYRSIDKPIGQHKQTWEDIKRWYENEDEEVKEFLRFLAKGVHDLSSIWYCGGIRWSISRI